MLYSSSYDALKKALVGVYKYVQACDYEEASEEAIAEAFRKGGKQMNDVQSEKLKNNSSQFYTIKNFNLSATTNQPTTIVKSRCDLGFLFSLYFTTLLILFIF